MVDFGHIIKQGLLPPEFFLRNTSIGLSIFNIRITCRLLEEVTYKGSEFPHSANKSIHLISTS